MSESSQECIAIIGLTGRFPGASNVDEFWRNLVAGIESISSFTDEELRTSGIHPSTLAQLPDYVRARGIMKDAEWFDAAFFGMTPREAEATDPQQRTFLEATWEALENAGYDPERYRGAIGVYAGMTNNTYYLQNLQSRRDITEAVGWLQTMMGNEKDYLATRVAYKLNLKGPAINIYTACSTSLVAVCSATQSLLNYQCDIALAGGVSISFPQHRGYQFQEGGITSPDGHCRAFDVNSAGTVFSHGLGIVVLKRLSEAIADGDQIHAVIKGAALNNDGSTKVSFTAPSVDGQAEVIALAQAIAGVEPESISYVEAHGTATPLGDPIEIAGLTQAFRAGTDKKHFCAIGSVKTNIGHLDVASGVAGLIKATLALKNKQIPPSLHYTAPNPKIDFTHSPFFVNAKLADWKADAAPRRAGVSSFGVGGTNAHVVMEEAPEREASSKSRPWQLLLLSAKTETALEAATKNLGAHLKANPDLNLADAAYTLQTGRAIFNHRRFVVCQQAADALTTLEPVDPKKVFTQKQELMDRPVVFMFPGQGAQYVNMGVELYRTEPVFKEVMDECAEILKASIGTDIREIIFPKLGEEEAAEKQLVQTRVTQPALFAIEYSLAKLWISWGIKPTAMIGHSVGEYVAGCLAEVFTLKEGLELVAARARLVQEQPGGTMLAIRLSEQEVQPFITGPLCIAAINSPNLCVVSGPYDAIEALEKVMEQKGIAGRRLSTSHAFHSTMMEPVTAPFTEILKKVPLKEPRIPYVSNVTAKWITAAETTDPHYWAGHVRQAVRFADGIGELLKDGKYVLLEVGPGQTLSTLSRQHPGKASDQQVVPSLTGTKEQPLDASSVLNALGKLWLAGVQPAWDQFYANERRHRVALPTYAFDRKRYWAEPAAGVELIPWASPPAGNAIPTSANAPLRPTSIAAEAAPVTSETAAIETEKEKSDLTRKERLLLLLKAQLQELSGTSADTFKDSETFLEMGFDSLFLTRASQAFHRRYGVKVTFRQLLEDLSTLDDLATFLDGKLAADALPAIKKAAQGATGETTSSSGIRVAAPIQADGSKAEAKYFGPFKQIEKGASGGLTERQQKHLDALIARYNKKTAGSKTTTQKHRHHLADPRAVAGFRQMWKEMVYPIVTNRSEGSKIWDVDGNEYVDITLGFGLGFLGHRPKFVVEAIQKQLDDGMEIGPASPLAGEVAALMCEFSGMERATFCNTGSEAVTAALRVSRTVTGRNKIAMFAGAYHGIFDEVLVRPQVVDGELRSAPVAPGIPQSMVENVIVLEYGTSQSLEILRKHGNEIAAVLVEPVQSRRPDFQPKEFLQEVRKITEETGTALIFDEVVTGFRTHPNGAQALFGVKADLASYGKVVGGGLPIGVLTGKAKFMDALDGGAWNYGDASFPEVGVTFFAGTFVRHPLALSAAKAVLTHLKEKGPDLQRKLDETTAKMVDGLNSHFEEIQVPVRLTRFSSMYFVNFAPEIKFASLFFYHMREKGIHIWESRPSFLSTVHTDQDVARVVSAFKESVAEMQAGGFLPETGVISNSFPLTEAQKEVWLGAQMGEDASRAFNDTVVVRICGALDRDLLRDSLQEIINRHDALRTTFARNATEQIVAPSSKLALAEVDLSTTPDKEKKLEELIANEDRNIFDLAKGPLLRLSLIKLAGDDFALVLAAHHLVCDGWSVGVLLHELSLIYSGKARKNSNPLAKAMQYREYSEWQNGTEYQRETEAAEAYWLKQFVNPPNPVELPTTRQRPPVKTHRSATRKLNIPPEFYQKIKQASAKQGSTLFAYLFASFNVWLHRLSGQTDLVVGIPAAGQMAVNSQNSPNSRALVGHCVNLLPVRTQCDGDPLFADYLNTVKGQVLDAYEHQNFTYGSLIKKLNIPRDPSRVPLVSTIFNVDRANSGFELQGLETEISSPAKQFHLFDLGINIVDTDKELQIDCRFNTDLFEGAVIERWLENWKILVEGIIENPRQELGKLPLLSNAERQQLIVDWNKPSSISQPTKCLQELFEAQVERTPDALAVTFESQKLTYLELNRRANQLAHYLRQSGVGPDIIVGICMDRSLELVVGLLGILKAGGAYLPIDLTYPQDRLAFMLEDAQAPVLLTQRKLIANLPADKSKVLCLDEPEQSALSSQPQDNPTCNTTPANLAYVIFTSGSTGLPKGALITHQNVTRLFAATDHWFKFNQNDVWTLFHSYAFDFSVWEIWGALLHGGRLVVVPHLVSRSPQAFHELIANEKVTVLNQTPSAFRQLIQAEQTADKPVELSLRYVIFGGEALEMQSLKPWFERHGDSRPQLINMYGITETTVHVTYRPLTQNDVQSASVIGVPIPDLQVYILNSNLQPTPIGVPGEMYVGGAGLGRGYLKRPELTAEKFIPDPFSPTPAVRLYKTGDLARFLPGRDIEYLGRIDHQVKIRGFRIELGEIESVLCQHSAVREAIVIALDDGGSKRLVGYVVAKDENKPSVNSLRDHLKVKVPEYMVPAAFVFLDKIPLTANGKVDRKALPKPEAGEAASMDNYTAPANPTEEMLVGIWAELLRVKRIGVHDSFFDLGGHSLVATQVISRVRDTYQVELSLGKFLESPTIAGLAVAIEESILEELSGMSEDEAARLANKANRTT